MTKVIPIKPKRCPMRRSTDRIRLVADEAWESGDKDLSTRLHNIAHEAEKRRGRAK